MGRRHSIAARKASGDAAKSKTYSIISKTIQIAAKKGTDYKINPSLDLALQKAKYYGVPKDIIQRAISKGSGQSQGDDLQEIYYEGYGPGGVAVIIKTLTSNINRTTQNIKMTMHKYGGTMGQQGSVLRQFTEKGVIIVNGKIQIDNIKGKNTQNIIPIDKEIFENEIIQTNASDFEIKDGLAFIYTDKQNFTQTIKQIKTLCYNIQESDIYQIPNNEIDISSIDKEKLKILINILEKDEDIEQVYNNSKD